MRRLILLLAALAGCAAPATSRDRVAYLTSDELAGRKVGSEGERKAAEYVAVQLRRLGVDAHIQPFEQGVSVVGTIPGSIREAVVIGAHIDHLGKSDEGIYRGADDNASGVAALLLVAAKFAQRPALRTIQVVGFGGEEAGILGSRHFVKQQVMPLVAMLNMDMVGRMVDRKLIVMGYNTSPVWEPALRELNTAGLDLSLGKGGVGPSDHTSFYQAGVPVLHFFTGAHRDYHKPSDTADKLNYEGIDLVADLVESVARRVADMPERPAYVKVSEQLDPASAPKGAPPYFGAMPDYAHQDRMQVAELAPGSPADRCGLKAGDVIVALDGKNVGDLEDYSAKLMSHRPGDEIVLSVRRGDALLEIRAVLAAKRRK